MKQDKLIDHLIDAINEDSSLLPKILMVLWLKVALKGEPSMNVKLIFNILIGKAQGRIMFNFSAYEWNMHEIGEFPEQVYKNIWFFPDPVVAAPRGEGER